MAKGTAVGDTDAGAPAVALVPDATLLGGATVTPGARVTLQAVMTKMHNKAPQALKGSLILAITPSLQQTAVTLPGSGLRTNTRQRYFTEPKRDWRVKSGFSPLELSLE